MNRYDYMSKKVKINNVHRNFCLSKKIFRKLLVQKTDWTGPGEVPACKVKQGHLHVHLEKQIFLTWYCIRVTDFSHLVLYKSELYLIRPIDVI